MSTLSSFLFSYKMAGSLAGWVSGWLGFWPAGFLAGWVIPSEDLIEIEDIARSSVLVLLGLFFGTLQLVFEDLFAIFLVVLS